MKIPFHFELWPHAEGDCEEPDLVNVTLQLTQEQFENKQLVDRLLEEEAAKIGIAPLAWWHERPPVAQELITSLRAAIGCDADTTLIFYYPARLSSRHFLKVTVDGHSYQYSNHPGSRVVKIVPELPRSTAPLAAQQSGSVLAIA